MSAFRSASIFGRGALLLGQIVKKTGRAVASAGLFGRLQTRLLD
jgi:hypothetical protein